MQRKSGAPEDKIEITPEMIKAGIDAVRDELQDTSGMTLFPGYAVRAIITAVMGDRILFSAREPDN